MPHLRRFRPYLQVAAFAGVFAAGVVVLQHHRRSRLDAEEAERVRAYPGDDLAGGDPVRTFAVTVPGDPLEVWPWIAQLGADRGGWYTHDLLDNGGRPSADRILPAHQEVRVGDLLRVGPRGRYAFPVTDVVPELRLVLGRPVHVPTGRPLPATESPAFWSFHLEPQEDHTTRLIVRTAGGSTRHWLDALRTPLWEHIDDHRIRRLLTHLRDQVSARVLRPGTVGLADTGL